jgi:signal transduction histidine kinase
MSYAMSCGMKHESKNAPRQDLSILDTLETAGQGSLQEDALMSSHSKSGRSEPRKKSRPPRPRRRHRRHRRDRYYDDESEHEDDPPLEVLDQEPRFLIRKEALYRDARMLAEERAELLLSAGKRGFIVILLLIFLPPLGVLALIFWGAKFGRRLIATLVEPRLRERLVEEQVSRHIHENLSEERRELADEHSHSLEVLSASIAHEIRNPITAAKSLLQQMRENPDAMDNEEYAQVALGELERVERSISHLLRFGRDEEVRKNSILMRDVLDSALETFRERSEREQVEIRRVFDCDGAMRGDAEKLRRVMINLIGNALDALQDAHVEEPVIEVSMGENLAGSEVWVKIRDNGFGIDAETRDQIFTPFYTAKSSGTGLGLAITKKLVDAHQGSIEVAAEPGEGAEFVLVFPKQTNGGNGRSFGDPGNSPGGLS